MIPIVDSIDPLKYQFVKIHWLNMVKGLKTSIILISSLIMSSLHAPCLWSRTLCCMIVIPQTQKKQASCFWAESSNSIDVCFSLIDLYLSLVLKFSRLLIFIFFLTVNYNTFSKTICVRIIMDNIKFIRIVPWCQNKITCMSSAPDK